MTSHIASKSQTPTVLMTMEYKESKLPLQSARLIWGSFALALLMVIGVCIGMIKQLGVGYSDMAPRILGNQTALRVHYISSEARMVNQLLDQITLRYASEGRNLDLKALVRQGVIDPKRFTMVQIVNARGELVLSSIEAPLGITLSHTQAFRTHESGNNGRMLIEAGAFGGGQAQDFFGFSKRLNGPDGVFAGVVLASFKPGHISETFDDVQMRFSGASHLVDMNGEIQSVLLGQDHQAIHDYKAHPFFQRISQGVTHGSYESTLAADGIKRVFIYEKIPDLDFVVVSSVAAHGWDGLLPSSKRALFAAAATLLTALLILLLSFRSHSIHLNKTLAQKQLLADQLKTSEERLSLAVICGRLGTWDWSLRDKQFRTNELFNTLFMSWPHEIDLGLLQEQIHPEDSEAFLLTIKHHLRDETSDFFCACRLRDPAGDWKWARVIGRVTERGADGSPLRLTGTVMDITEQHSLQTQLEDHGNQLATIFGMSQDALVVFDQNRLVKFISPAFKRLTTLEPSALVGLDEVCFAQKLNERCTPDKPFCGLPALRESVQTTGARPQKSLVLQGPVARVLMATLTTNTSSSVSQILSLRDVSHETLIEKLKSEFLSTAAHEIRSPMASILGFAELMTDPDLNVSDRSEFSNIILSQSYRIKGLLDELLDLARIDAGGGQHFVFEPVDLHALVNTVVTEFMPPDDRSPPTVNVPSQPSQPCQIDFDKAAQALLNVISNAYKYSEKTSPVNISYVSPAVINHQEMAGITVQDVGIGMRQAEQERVFERFYRANQKSTVAGSGLGMAIVKEIMTLHGGEVVIKSVHGQGTAVTLLFPTLEPITPLPTSALAEASVSL